jgi:predicted small metal-binding protein
METPININSYKSHMIKLSCKESGLECNYVAEGKTVDEVLKDISEHAVNFHNMRAEDTYEENISAAFLCQAIGKMTSLIHNDNKEKLD